MLDGSSAALQYCGMSFVIPMSKRGTVTLPPELRRSLGLDQLENPMLLAEERNGQLVLVPATAVPVRDIPKAQLDGWIAEDERAMESFAKAKPKPKRSK